MDEINKEKEVREFFYSPEQYAAVNMSNSCDDHGRHVPVRDKFVQTPNGWREFTESAVKGYYTNGVNKFGAKAFFESANAQTKYFSINDVEGRAELFANKNKDVDRK